MPTTCRALEVERGQAGQAALAACAGRARAACAPRTGAASRSAAGARRRPPRAPRRPSRAACTRGEHPLRRSPCTARPRTGVIGSRSTHQLRGSRSAPSPTREPLALEAVGALDQPLVDRDRQLELRGDRLGGLLRALQRAGHHVGDVAVGERLRRPPWPSARPARRGGSRAAGRTGSSPGCGPRRAAARARPSSRSSRRAPRCRRPRRGAAAPRRSAPARRRRAPPTRTTTRTRSAAGRRRGRASRGRTP